MSSSWGVRSCAVAAIFAIVATGAAIGATPPNAVPTSVSIVSGRYGDGKLAGLVAIQRLAPGTVRIAGLVTGLPAGKTVLAMARGDYCGNGMPGVIARGSIRGDRAFDLTVKLTEPIGNGAWLALLRPAPVAGSKPLACVRVQPFARAGTIVSPRDTASGQATGIAVLQRSKGPIAIQAFVSQTLPLEDGLILEFKSGGCSDAPSTTNTIQRVLPLRGAPVARGLAVELMFDSLRASHSVTLAARVGTAKQWIACTKWELSELDA